MSIHNPTFQYRYPLWPSSLGLIPCQYTIQPCFQYLDPWWPFSSLRMNDPMSYIYNPTMLSVSVTMVPSPHECCEDWSMGWRICGLAVSHRMWLIIPSCFCFLSEPSLPWVWTAHSVAEQTEGEAFSLVSWILLNQNVLLCVCVCVCV